MLMKLNLKSDRGITFTGVLVLLLLEFFGGVELNFLIFLLIIWFFFQKSVNRRLIKVLMPLLIIVSIGATVFFLNLPSFILFIKDFVFFTKPIIGILAGYFLFNQLKDKNNFYTIILYSGVIFAVLHILSFSQVLIETGFNLHGIREKLNLDNYIEVFALLVFGYSLKKNILFFNRRVDRALLGLLVLSVFLYLSRSMILMTVILWMLFIFDFKISLKQFISSLLVVLFGFVFILYLNTMDLSISSDGLDSFLYKIRMAPTELFFDESKNKDLRYLYDHWRGFEAHQALLKISSWNFPIGNGFGSSVDLGKEYLLGGTYLRNVPIIHNGYVFVLFKTGVIGLLLYIFFIINSFHIIGKSKSQNKVDILLGKGILIFWVFSTFVVTGLYNQGEIITFIFGGVLVLNFNFKMDD